ncbi:MAG TPA: P-loop NTPase [Ktedonobacterales bacterium]|nr:P-loop NTPase [Ktedonobacterales bacterium]
MNKPSWLHPSSNNPEPRDARHTPPARFIIAVGSGKGGVGKSTVSLNLALALAENGKTVGLLDADLYGPNIPLMVGLTRKEWTGNWTLARKGPQPVIQPVERYGLKIMSAGFLLGEDQPMILEAQIVRALLMQLTHQVAWGNPDYLIIDLPPGTADLQQNLLQDLQLSGVVLIVTPQDVAHLDGKKALQYYRRADVPILGAIENMSGFLCPHCGQPVDIFARVSEARAIWTMDVEKLGAIPLDPLVSQSGDRAHPLLVAHPQSAQAAAFRQIAQQLAAKLEATPD